MTAAVSSTAGSATPEAPVSRSVRLIRVVVLLVAGFAIAFTATLHEQLAFDLGLASAALGAIGLAHLIEWIARRASSPSPVPLLLGAVAVIAAVVAPLTASAIGFAVTISAWALVSALLEFIGAAVRPGSRQDAALLGAVGVLLSILVLFVREDPVAVLGFFGGYAVIAGVFLGISAFDPRGSRAARSSGEQAAAATQQPASEAR